MLILEDAGGRFSHFDRLVGEPNEIKAVSFRLAGVLASAAALGELHKLRSLFTKHQPGQHFREIFATGASRLTGFCMLLPFGPRKKPTSSQNHRGGLPE